MTITVYSCVTDGYDNLAKILFASQTTTDSDVAYVLYTNKVAEASKLAADSRWDVRPVRYSHPVCPRRTARWHKVNSQVLFPDSDYVIWIDGNQRIKVADFHSKVISESLSSADIAAFRHPDRSCVYQELTACENLRKDSVELMRAQIKRYRKEAYPAYHGLVETSCVARRRSVGVAKFNTAWWSEIDKGSVRDQLSFNYVSWKLKMTYGIISGCRDNSPYFQFSPH